MEEKLLLIFLKTSVALYLKVFAPSYCFDSNLGKGYSSKWLLFIVVLLLTIVPVNCWIFSVFPYFFIADAVYWRIGVGMCIFIFSELETCSFECLKIFLAWNIYLVLQVQFKTYWVIIQTWVFRKKWYSIWRLKKYTFYWYTCFTLLAEWWMAVLCQSSFRMRTQESLT